MKLNPNKNPAYVILFAVIISGLFTAAIMGLHTATAPMVRANERLLTEKAIVDLFALGDVEEMSADQIGDLIRRRVGGMTDPDRPDDPRAQEIHLTDEETGDSIRLLVDYNTDLPPDRKVEIHDKRNILGYAFPIKGVGFWAMIEGWFAVDTSGDRSLGVVFIRHQETPGLGGRITEAPFREQFKGLNVSPPEDADKFIYIERESPAEGSPKYRRHVDTVTGATGTSMAIEKFMNDDIRRFRRIAESAGLFDRPGGAGERRAANE